LNILEATGQETVKDMKYGAFSKNNKSKNIRRGNTLGPGNKCID
jgi:hypothetical protein